VGTYGGRSGSLVGVGWAFMTQVAMIFDDPVLFALSVVLELLCNDDDMIMRMGMRMRGGL
jgi:hypothetical protein